MDESSGGSSQIMTQIFGGRMSDAFRYTRMVMRSHRNSASEQPMLNVGLLNARRSSNTSGE